MDESRDVQISKRNGTSMSLVSTGSAMAMEIKRKKTRQSTVFQQTEVVMRNKMSTAVISRPRGSKVHRYQRQHADMWSILYFKARKQK